jgi:ribosomal protein S18 acetylase RimI-like enzyme
MYQILEADLENPSHTRGLIECLDSYASDEMGGEQPLSAAVKSALIPGLKAQAGHLILLALEADLVVGIAICFMGFSTFAAKPRLNVHDLCVLPSHRGQGIGRRLLTSVMERARSAGACGVTLEVRTDNRVARRLYRSLGFTDAFAPMEFWQVRL